MGMHTFEIYYQLTFAFYDNLKTELFKSGKHHKQDNNTIIFEKLKSNGIIIKLYRQKQEESNSINCYNHYTVSYIINPRRVLDEKNYVGIFNSEDDVDQMVYMVDRYLYSYSKALPELNMCKIKRVDYCHNIKLNDDLEVSQLCKLLKRCMIPTGFEFEKFYDKTAKRSVVSNNGIRLKSNSVTISIYNKKHQLEKQKRNYYGDIMDANGIVRLEIQCKKGKIKKLIEKYGTGNVQDFLNKTSEISIDVFDHYLSKMYGTGDILTLAEAERVIKKNKYRKDTEKLMLELLKNTATYSNLEKSYQLHIWTWLLGELKFCLNHKAKKDFSGAKILFEYDGDNSLVAFHCQQSIEKSLKGYIIKNTSDLIEGHSLIYLRKKAVNIDDDFKKFLKDCAYVNQFYIETRYPADIPNELSKDEAKDCIDIAEKILKYIIS